MLRIFVALPVRIQSRPYRPIRTTDPERLLAGLRKPRVGRIDHVLQRSAPDVLEDGPGQGAVHEERPIHHVRRGDPRRERRALLLLLARGVPFVPQVRSVVQVVISHRHHHLPAGVAGLPLDLDDARQRLLVARFGPVQEIADLDDDVRASRPGDVAMVVAWGYNLGERQGADERVHVSVNVSHGDDSSVAGWSSLSFGIVATQGPVGRAATAECKTGDEDPRGNDCGKKDQRGRPPRAPLRVGRRVILFLDCSVILLVRGLPPP
mmetsp:Transcript_7605/g.13415  ORF Transcript_7605/g.13415 Transcript_7605/m.13415 type:complete len:265 (+) Transcript_7605:417-1211(+)